MMKILIEQLKEDHDLCDGALADLIESNEPDDALFAAADAVRRAQYGTDVYLRGLI